METVPESAPLNPQSRNWPAAAAVAVYVLLMLIWKGLGWQHLGLALLFWACLTTAPGPRRFVRDWWPMILFWLGYDVMRVFASSLFSRVAVEDPLRWEAALFRGPEGHHLALLFRALAGEVRRRFLAAPPRAFLQSDLSIPRVPGPARVSHRLAAPGRAPVPAAAVVVCRAPCRDLRDLVQLSGGSALVDLRERLYPADARPLHADEACRQARLSSPCFSSMPTASPQSRRCMRPTRCC